MLTEGHELLEAGRWREARDAFEAATSSEASAEAFEGLAKASLWLDEIGTAIEAREHAYRLYAEYGDMERAALMAVGLASIFVDHRGEPAVASGWLQRARHQLRESPESAMFVEILGYEAYLALAYEKDPVAAQTLVERALDLAHELGHPGVEAMAEAQLGLVRVSRGHLKEGMRLLDGAAAAAVAGELGDHEALNVYCFMITACERVRDFDRVGQWARRVLAMATGIGTDRFSAFARTQYASVLIWRGDWAQAETELASLTVDAAKRPLSAAMGMVLMASLRRRQGRFEEADQLLSEVEREPFRRGVRHLVLTARAALELETGNPRAAADLTERYLRSVSTEDRIERVEALEILVRAQAMLDNPEAAATAASELSVIAGAAPTDGMEGAAHAATGVAARAEGDLIRARDAFDGAVALFDAGEVPHEAARARLELARVLVEIGELGAARREAVTARDEALALGATGDLALAEGILARLRPAAGGPHQLSSRELEVLRLLAAGRTNSEVADALFISVRTVERHISNIYAKIGASGRSARVVATSYANRHGIT
jgi:ATP/maltotriose-dependent transcriptional regulator MalT